jgi:hypothetical protein
MKLSYYYNVCIGIAVILYISLMVIKEIFASTVLVTLINILLKKYDMTNLILVTQYDYIHFSDSKTEVSTLKSE